MIAPFYFGWKIVMTLFLFASLLLCGCFPFITGSNFLFNRNTYDEKKLKIVTIIGYCFMTLVSFITLVLKVYATVAIVSVLNVLFPVALLFIFLLMTLASNTWCKLNRNK